MGRLTLPMWTLVQHSAYGYKQDLMFNKAVEDRHLSLDSEVAKVKSAGGVLFDNYNDAVDAAEAANYPPEVSGMIARVRGKFSRKQIDGLCIYIPEEKETPK
jgi:hypothetical protein